MIPLLCIYMQSLMARDVLVSRRPYYPIAPVDNDADIAQRQESPKSVPVSLHWPDLKFISIFLYSLQLVIVSSWHVGMVRLSGLIHRIMFSVYTCKYLPSALVTINGVTLMSVCKVDQTSYMMLLHCGVSCWKLHYRVAGRGSQGWRL